jgi:predicted nucleic acid-binding protein
MIYLDTSAALKLVLPEAETVALELWIAQRAGIRSIWPRRMGSEQM